MKANRGVPLPSVADLCRRYSYDESTGVLTRAERRRSYPAGSRVGKIDHYGYLILTYVDGGTKRYIRAHRVIFKMMTGADPSGEVDHINGDRLDNRWVNLRDSTRLENRANAKMQSNNRSGFKGVVQRGKKWTACIKGPSGGVVIGYFQTPEEAHAAYAMKASEIFGDFARSS